MKKAFLCFYILFTLLVACSDKPRSNLKRKTSPSETQQPITACSYKAIKTTILEPISLPKNITLEKFSPFRASIVYKKVISEKKDAEGANIIYEFKVISEHMYDQNIRHVVDFVKKKVTMLHKFRYTEDDKDVLMGFCKQKKPSSYILSDIKNSENLSFNSLLMEGESLPEHDLSVYFKSPSLCNEIQQKYMGNSSKNSLLVDHKYYAYSKNAEHVGTFTGITFEDESLLTPTCIHNQIISIEKKINSRKLTAVFRVNADETTYFDCAVLKDETILLFGYIWSNSYGQPGKLFISQVKMIPTLTD